MCGSQLTRLHTIKAKELESEQNSMLNVEEQLPLTEEAKDGKDNPLIKPILPVCDEGGMRFPCQHLFA